MSDINERAELKRIISALRRFNALDGAMQVSTILALLEVADAEFGQKAISVAEIEKSVGMKSGTASRNAYYWAEGHQSMAGGYKFIKVRLDPNDRRRRSLTMTSRGQAFISELTRSYRHGETTG